ncbi:MAG: Type IIS restriction enzyme Eco57I [Firmicutes bacterium ADurb.Bin080]|jgi:type I restriction-modification system DNA methylase subunit|nr:MAG: Type IIS restriction enzyme Eco57I [Firmicutes bacterium ADurb.Bin080]
MTNKQTAKEKIESLVIRFEEQFESYKNSDYNETLTRRDFIDPFFKALGWDIDNESGYAEAYREVIHEDKVKVSGSTKAPDYSFRLVGGKRLFFVEAKKPSISVKEDIQPAYQVRRYGWSAKLPISIITDFEEFSIYDCTKKPKPNDKPPVARIKYLSFRDYIKEFDFLWDTFSKEQVLKGSFDKYLQSDTHKKGTATVDKDFLESLDRWRTYLAVSISWNNKTLDEEEINFVVQQTIDRIIFLRIAEDRGVEPYGTLHHATKLGNLYQNLFELFQKADQKYNSGLFDFKKDKISQDVIIDNKVIKTILNELYYPECPYEFSVLSVEILGSAYEQFLGKVIRITPAHHAKIEEKPEVRKAGGVYYTPQYIVDYIVKSTVGKLIEGKTPKEISKIKILDPACGSGSFLIGAFQYLLDYHKDYYSENGKPSKGKKDNPLTPEGNLTSAEKKRILLNNIFGVDLDANAVEVTKLSLLIKCLEGETDASIQQQLSIWHERVLPTLESNIKNGNSLIDTDFYSSELELGFEKNIKPFNWRKNFPLIFDEGGFDAIIGNPPYVMLQNLEKREVFEYSSKKYRSAKYKIDTYQLFIERSITLLRKDGLLGFITPNTFLKNIHAEPLRRLIIETTQLNELLIFNYSVFTSASVDTCIIILENKIASPQTKVEIKEVQKPFYPIFKSSILQNSFTRNQRLDFNVSITDIDIETIGKIESESVQLNTYCKAYFGIQTFDRNKFVAKEKLSDDYQPVIDGSNISFYYLIPATEYVLFKPSAIKSGGEESIYRQERICLRQIGASPIATIVPANLFTLNTIYNVYLKVYDHDLLLFLLAIINSRTTKYYWQKKNSDEKKTFPKIKKEAILSIPVPRITNPVQESIKTEIIKLVDQTMTLKKELTLTKVPAKADQILNRTDFYLERIDELIFDLYNFSISEKNLINSLC